MLSLGGSTLAGGKHRKHNKKKDKSNCCRAPHERWKKISQI